MFRTVSDALAVRQAIAPLERRVTIEHVLEVPPVRMTTVPGFDTAVFPYTTDIPFLPAGASRCCSARARFMWRTRPTSSSRSPSSEAAVDGYVALARHLLAVQS